MSTQYTPSADGTHSAADTTHRPSSTFCKSQPATSSTGEALLASADPSTTATTLHHGMLRADIVVITTTTTATILSGTAVCTGAGTDNSPHIQQQQDLAQLTELMEALSLRTPDPPATPDTPSPGDESGYEADEERNLERPKTSRRQEPRRTLRKRQRRRVPKGTAVARSKSGSPPWQGRTTQEACQRWSRQRSRRSI